MGDNHEVSLQDVGSARKYYADKPLDMFSPLAFPTGIVIYDMSTASPTPSQLALVPFELYREPLVILGIADGLEYFQQGTNENQPTSTNNVDHSQETEGPQSSTIDYFSSSLAWLKETYTPALVHQIFIFDALAPMSSVPDSLVFIPRPEKSKKTVMKTVMCDLTSVLLSEMTSYAKSLQALSSIETPLAYPGDTAFEDRQARSSSRAEDPGRPGSRLSNASTTRSSSPAVDGGRHQYRGSLPAHLSSRVPPESTSESEGLRLATNGSRPPPITFDEMNNSTERPSQSTFVEQEYQPSKDRVSVQGFGSGSIGERVRNKAKARMGVVIGSMYLLAGRWPDAVKELAESASIARASNDHVWHAKSLDYILVCLLLFGWAGMDFDVREFGCILD